MRKVAFFFFVFVLLGVFLLSSGGFRVNAQVEGPQNNTRQRLIIKFKPQALQSSRDSVFSAQGILRHESLRLADAFVVEVPKKASFEILNKLKKNPIISFVEEDFIASAFEIPNDPRFPEQWGLTKIQAPSAWGVTHGGGLIDIAILDTGIDGNHPDFGGKISVSVNCTQNSSCPSVSPTDIGGHGSHVAGIASAVTNNSVGVAGVAWDGRLMNVKVLDNQGSGYYSWVTNGIMYASDNGAEVINLSLGGSSSSNALRDAIDYAWSRGVVIIAASGNNGRNLPNYPAYYPNAIAVAATDQNDSKASFSNYGSWVDVSAPGVNILSIYKGGYGNLTGTSMSTPFVSGLAGLLFGQNPSWTNSQVRNRIEATADKISGTGNYWTYGRINVCKAVGCLDTTQATPVPTFTPTPTASPTLTPTTTPSPQSTPPSTTSPSPSPSPTPSSLPWWCSFIPWHTSCQ